MAPLGGVKRSKHFFLKEVMLHVKLRGVKGMEHRAAHKHIFCHYTHPQPLRLSQNIFFLKVVMLFIKLKVDSPDHIHYSDQKLDISAWAFINFLASGSFRHLLITVANSLDPDQDEWKVCPELDRNR